MKWPSKRFNFEVPEVWLASGSPCSFFVMMNVINETPRIIRFIGSYHLIFWDYGAKNDVDIRMAHNPIINIHAI